MPLHAAVRNLLAWLAVVLAAAALFLWLAGAGPHAGSGGPDGPCELPGCRGHETPAGDF